MRIINHDCPVCGFENDVDYEKPDKAIKCSHCGAGLLVDHDAEFTDGSWRDLTKLHPMTTHTPGPWKLVAKRGKRGQRVCRAIIRCGEHEGLGAPEVAWIKGSIADSNLIAAAPDLLAALELARTWMAGFAMAKDDLAIVDAAIAKAKGQP